MLCRMLKNLFMKYKRLQPIEERVYLRFLVISDLHITQNKIVEQKRLRNVLKAAYHLNRKLDAVVIAGDLTDSGEKGEYKTVKCILDRYVKDNTIIIASMGNHEYNTKEIFTSIMNLKPKDNVKIGGYHFITLSPRESESEYGGSRYYLDSDWLLEQLKEAHEEDEKKPIFLITHHGIKDTAFGTDEWNTEDLYDILKNYPEVIHFAGHSHYPLNNPKSIYQKEFTEINTSTISYFDFPKDIERNIEKSIVNKVCQALLVEVIGEDVRIRKLDLIHNSYIGEDWRINTAENVYGYKYTESRLEKSMKPYFSCSAKAEIENIGSNSCSIKISQANIKGSKDVIEYYKVTFLNTETGVIDKECKVWSQYGIKPIPKKIIYDFEGLKGNTKYEVVVKAYNAYEKSSTNDLRVIFKTK